MSKSGKRAVRSKAKAGPRAPSSGTEVRAAKRQSEPTSGAGLAPRYVVGVGSSAGGLEALRCLLGALTDASALAVVIVQHLAPQHRSRLVELIGQGTRLNVREASERQKLERNTVYVTPPNSDVVLEGGLLTLKRPEARVGPKPSVDRFFTSLADERGESAIGVILSGTGSDGARGIRALKAAGGVTFCQTAATAKYDGMPRAARQTGAVDMELPAEEIARQLSRLSRLALERGEKGGPAQHLHAAQDPYRRVLSSLARVSRVDFAQYKPSTIRRRIERRMLATRCESLSEYAEFLTTHPEEGQLLFQDVLISVTSFFRDAEAFRALQKHLAARAQAKAASEPFRCWVVGCATGEEAFSLAIDIHEALQGVDRPGPVQIFATDIDEQALAVARKGLYAPSALAHVPAKLRERYFEPHDEQLRVKALLRDSIVFARHDVTQDPPFLKLDLVSCRNVLIYFSAALQAQVLKTFNFALGERGLLFLGNSEATAAGATLFDLADKHAKIFWRSAGRGELPKPYSRQELHRETALQQKDRATSSSVEAFNALVRGFAPDSVLVDEGERVVHTFGQANRYLNLPRGAPSVTLTKLLPAPVALEVTTLLRRAEHSHRAAKGDQRHTFFGDNGEPVLVSLQVVPVSLEGRSQAFVCFQPVSTSAPARALPKDAARLTPRQLITRLETELASTREHLQTVVEEHETANEELQALNEELQSSNEELQSSNEELETTNEELQSANEELTTLNEEINVKSVELSALSQRLQAIQQAIYYPLLVVDGEGRLVDYNSAAGWLLRVGDPERGLPLRSVPFNLDIAPVVQLVEDALKQGRDARLQYRTSNRDFEVRVQLYRGTREQVEGAVLSFVENTELVHALESSRVARERLATILENTPALVSMKDATGAYEFANRRFCELIGHSPEQVVGKTDEELFGEEVGAVLRERDFEVLRQRTAQRFVEIIPVGGERRHWLSSKFPLLDDRKTARSVCTVSLDISERHAHEQKLEVFKQLISASTAGLAIFAKRDGQFRAIEMSASWAHQLRLEPSLAAQGVALDQVLEAAFGRLRSFPVGQLKHQLETRPNTSVTLNLEEPLGEERWLEVKSATLRFEGGDQEYLVLSVFDVTERVRADRLIEMQEQELTRFGNLATLGELSSGIAHEINTPLSVITTRADLLRRLAEREQLQAAKVGPVTDEIVKMAEAVSGVVSGLRSLSGLEHREISARDVRDLVREASRACLFRIQRSGAHLELDLPPEPAIAECQPVQVMQICINLLNNASDAVATLKDQWIRVQVKNDADQVLLRVTDSGTGIDPAIAEKVMTPFFTTKRDQQGTGLGLSISRKIAQQHGGELRLLSEERHTTFELVLPKKLERLAEEQQPSAEARP